MAYDAFISFKNNDASGQRTADSRIAEALYARFKDAGINVFFSNVTLFEFGETAYKDAIEHAIIDARVMIVIGTCLDYLTSTWVKYEWSSFHEEILSGDKPGGTIVPYLSQSITRAERPMALRNFESFAIETTPVDQVVAGTDVQMIGIGKFHLTVDLPQVFSGHTALDGGAGADIHENGSLDDAVYRLHAAAAGMAFGSE